MKVKGMCMSVVHVINLGRMSYVPTLRLQKWLEQKHLTTEGGPQTLILVEHDPVYTAGFREKLSSEEKQKLVSTGAEFIQSDRGGLMTFHGPGQLVAYPILHLEKFHPRLSLRKYVSLLESAGVHTFRMLGLHAKVSTEGIAHTGAWVNDRKICAVGVHCRRHVTTHGLALNNNVDLAWYENIVPCGILDKGVTSIKEELGAALPMSTMMSQFLQSFQIMFKCQLEQFDQNTLTQILSRIDNNDGSNNSSLESF